MEEYVGKSLKFMGPSGIEYTIREQNGDDDEILSAIKTDEGSDNSNGENITNINNFIQTIIIETSNGKYLTLEDVKNMNLRDKYYILMKSRIHSHGPKIKFDLKCPKCGVKTEGWTEDLTEFDTNLYNKNPEIAPNEKAIETYPNGGDKWVEHTLSSGKLIKFKLMDGYSELFILEAGKSSLNANLIMYSRDLQIKDGSDWVKLSKMNVFSPKDMVEIRSQVEKFDLQFSIDSICKCPNCKREQQVPLTKVPDFFFPTEE